MGQTPQPIGGQIPHADAVLEFMSAAPDQGAICALLTPAVKARLREMSTGQVLEVQADDPAAGEDLASWCRLAGHELLAVIAGRAPRLRIFVRKSHG